MLSVSRPAREARTPIARIILAMMLALVLLAGVAPFSSFSSPSHECAMACCMGKPPHMAGSCSTALGSEEGTETPAERGEEVSAHEHKTHSSVSTNATVTQAKRRGAAKHSSTRHSTSSGEESPRTPRVSSQAMTAPCSPECAAALSSSQMRRPRDPATAAVIARPRPHALCFITGRDFESLPESAERRSLLRPRAPPHFFIHLSA